MPLLPPEECASAVRLIHDYPASVWLFQLRHLRELIPHLEPRVKAGDLLARDVLYQASRTVSLISGDMGPASMFGHPAGMRWWLSWAGARWADWGRLRAALAGLMARCSGRGSIRPVRCVTL